MRPDDVANEAMRAAKAAGADQVEAYVVSSRSVSAYIDDSAIKSVEEKMDLGVAIRVLKGGRLGQASSSISSLRQVQDCARTAVKTAALIPVDKVFGSFAQPVKGRAWFKVKDPEVASADIEDVAERLKEVIGAAKEERKVKVPNGLMRVAELESVVTNTNDLLTRREASLVFLNLSAMTQGTRPGEGTEYFFSPYLKELDAGKVGGSLKAKAKAAAKAKAFKGKVKLQAVLPPHELAEMLRSSIQFALSAENVNRKRSPLVGKVGRKVTAKCLSIIDDPMDRRGVLSSPFDDEGTPATRKTLVEDGVLRGFLNDLYNSHLSSVEPTGNGLRRSSTDTLGNYQLGIGISPICLVMKPGTRSIEDMVGAMDHGLLVEKTASPEVHPITGDFGLEIRCAYLVEKGEVKSTVKHCLLSGNMFRALSQIGGVANDATVSQNLIVPSVLFEDFELIGSE